MHYTLIEDYSADQVEAEELLTLTVAGETYPDPCLVEDADGARILLTSGDFIEQRYWDSAYDAGVAMLLREEDQGIHSVCSTERFLEHRTEQPWSTWSIPFQGMVGARVPTYRDLVEGDAKPPEDDGPGEFVHLHTHSEFSSLDGLSNMEEIVAAAVADGQKAVAVCDHGNCAGHPTLQEEADKAGIKAIFGMEAYLVPNRHRRAVHWWEIEGTKVSEERAKDFLANASDSEKAKCKRVSDAQEALNEYQHLTLWAMDDTGLRNLWAMSTKAYLEGFYGKPRLDWEVLAEFSEGVLCGTGCLRGPVAHPMKDERYDEAKQNLARLHEIYGDRLYVEIHTNHLPEQVEVNKHIVPLAQQFDLPMIAVVDAHYATPEHKSVHQAWLAIQQDKDLTDDTTLFAGGQDYHLKTAAEVRESLAYLGELADVEEMLANTVRLAQRCTATVRGETEPPVYSKSSRQHPDPVRRDYERVVEIALSAWERKVVGKPKAEQTYMERFEREMRLLWDKRFCGYFLVVWDYVKWAKDNGILVGPSRGSGGGSLVAYLMDIIEVDPVDADLMFERFLNEGRNALPDFDIDFPATKRGDLKGYVAQRWGEDHVATIGTTTRLQNKGAINDSVRVLKTTLDYEVPFTEVKALKDAITEADRSLAGKHLPWDEFCAQYEDLVDPMRSDYPEVFELIDVIVNRVRTYGKHAAGVVISTGGPITDLPLRMTTDGLIVTQFDMNALERLGYIKFDFLTLRTLDTIQDCVDLVRERYGISVNVYEWRDEYEDPQVWEEVAAGRTMGLFQVETSSGTRLIQRYKPQDVHGLAAVMTLVRPGPDRSGLTKVYLRRRAGIEPVSYPHPSLEEALSDSYGVMIYQEQIMAICQLLAGYTLSEADEVRSILGKKKTEKVKAAGEEFLRRAREFGTEEEIAASLWEQMAEFAKYAFNRAHAYGYAVLGYWCAWFKFHFPVQFLTAALGTVDAERIPDFITETRRMGYTVLPPDINESNVHFTPAQMTVRYGLADIKGVGVPTAQAIVDNRPYLSLDDFTTRMVEPKNSPIDRGTLRILVEVGAFDSLVENRRAIEMQLGAEVSGEAKTCVHKSMEVSGPNGLPCTFDWANEPDPPMVTKGRGKNKVLIPKDPPKRCTVACRQYRKPDPLDPASIHPYTDAEVRAKEKELLGVWVSSSPFDDVPAEVLEQADDTDTIMSGPTGEEYVAVVLVEGVREKRDKNGNRYAFLSLNARGGTFDAICFASKYEGLRPHVKVDRLGAAILTKNSRGVQVLDYSPMN